MENLGTYIAFFVVAMSILILVAGYIDDKLSGGGGFSK